MQETTASETRRRRGVIAAHALAAGLGVADAKALELPGWAPVAALMLVTLHLLAALAIGSLASLAISAVPVLLGVALLLVRAAGDNCDPCAGGWRDAPLGLASVLAFVFLVDIAAGPLWGLWRRR
jgi:hypothetical protein